MPPSGSGYSSRNYPRLAPNNTARNLGHPAIRRIGEMNPSSNYPTFANCSKCGPPSEPWGTRLNAEAIPSPTATNMGRFSNPTSANYGRCGAPTQNGLTPLNAEATPSPIATNMGRFSNPTSANCGRCGAPADVGHQQMWGTSGASVSPGKMEKLAATSPLRFIYNFYKIFML